MDTRRLTRLFRRPLRSRIDGLPSLPTIFNRKGRRIETNRNTIQPAPTRRDLNTCTIATSRVRSQLVRRLWLTTLRNTLRFTARKLTLTNRRGRRHASTRARCRTHQCRPPPRNQRIRNNTQEGRRRLMFQVINQRTMSRTILNGLR